MPFNPLLSFSEFVKPQFCLPSLAILPSITSTVFFFVISNHLLSNARTWLPGTTMSHRQIH